ncbi:uncharacterized protein A1O9_12807 [Exophiala aquamarina CBS 119918]|uniref:NAD(P)-binding domain-containing protein n=1 Tax=Exophiala aquamarina CBS 119918 TaxID=1182545 RepID=A0A072NVZ0_9EURO|nr:uncharacterized protein A1O9_12807 [Exophiala aquamarina CBS 119918]KEF51193.1 hypothetical protein A1O9_12807 [Exophiala aquamarina CBS 119918]
MASMIESLPTLALLGATGKTGREVLKLLLKRDFQWLRIYVRSKQKLLNLFPQLISDARIQICEGQVTDQKTMQECLSGAQVIIYTIGGYSYFPDNSLQNSAESMVAALRELQARNTGGSWERPRVIFLSSSTLNTRFAAARPRLIDWLIKTAFQNGYNDLKRAVKAVQADPSLLSVLFVQPAVLVEEDSTGSYVSVDDVKLACSYEDLGAGFVELALNRGYDELHEIGCSSSKGNRVPRYLPIMLRKIAAGFFAFYVPGALQVTNALETMQRWIW